MSNRDLSTLLAELDAAYEKMTPGKMFPIRVADATTPEAMLEAMRISIEASPGSEMFGININGNPDTVELGPDEKCVAYTGNGPTSKANAIGIVALVNAYPQLREALREGIAQLQREKATDAWHTGWQQAVKERDEARRECDQWREKWNATLDREARRNAEILQLKAANNEMREVLLTLSTAEPKLLAEQPEMTAGIARMALQLANHWAAKGSVDAA